MQVKAEIMSLLLEKTPITNVCLESNGLCSEHTWSFLVGIFTKFQSSRRNILVRVHFFKLPVKIMIGSRDFKGPLHLFVLQFVTPQAFTSSIHGIHLLPNLHVLWLLTIINTMFYRQHSTHNQGKTT